MNKSLYLPGLILFFLSSCAPSTDKKDSPVVAEDLAAEQFSGQIIADQAGVVLDVRTPEEFQSGHIAKAINMDYNAPDFAQKTDGLDKTKTYYVYCKAGVRSGKAADILRSKGFHAVTLNGGLDSWSASGLPVTQ